MSAQKSSTTLMDAPHSSRPIVAGMSRKAICNGVKTVVLYAIILLMASLTLIPFLWMLSTSLKVRDQLYAFPPEWIPDPITFESYRVLFDPLPFGTFFLNSLQVALLSTTGTLLACSLAAYAFARLRFPGREIIFALLLTTMMIPAQVLLLPLFILYKNIGWLDTLYPLWVPSFFGSAFGTFLLRQFFLSLPSELTDAAKIDGCSHFGIYWRIILPLSGPGLATLGIFTFMGSWNSFLVPLIVINKIDLRTVPLGLAALQGSNEIRLNAVMAASTLSILPILIVFFFAQKYFVQGVVLTGIKG
ncbi:MAG TPA: carbohydrate ABC transporter permease [Caldilineaceae bacterium]|nr:carbohydrate ABC transporter permease [Caldilineaceae bacterium]